MKKIIALICAGLSSLAMAETVDFNGTVSTACTFSNHVAGTIVPYAVNGIYQMTSEAGSGQRASIQIDYTGAPQFSITAPNGFVSAPGNLPTINTYNTGVEFNGNLNNSNANAVNANIFSSGTKTFSLDDNITTDTLSVKFQAEASSAFPIGNYSAQVVLTCQ